MKNLEEIRRLSLELIGPVRYEFPDGCDDDDERSRFVRRRARHAEFQKKCPVEFRQALDLSKLKNPGAWQEGWAWAPGTFPGLWIWSAETGRGKTRFAWHKIGQAFLHTWADPLFVTGVQLYDLAYNKWREGSPGEFRDFFRRRSFVVLDDLDKFYLGKDEIALMLRELFDFFYRERVSVIVTANVPPEQFAATIGGSAQRRILEVCQPIAF